MVSILLMPNLGSLVFCPAVPRTDIFPAILHSFVYPAHFDARYIPYIMCGIGLGLGSAFLHFLKTESIAHMTVERYDTHAACKSTVAGFRL